MLRDKSFRRVGPSLWGLDAWYPQRKPSKAEDETEPELEAPDNGNASQDPSSEEEELTD